MYTHEKVSGLLRPIAFCVLLVLGAAPAATLACQWACAPQSGQAHRHDGHHQDSSEAVHASQTTVDTAAVRSSESACDHRAVLAPALTSASVKVFAPLATLTADFEPSNIYHVVVSAGAYVTDSPPGARSRPLSLRI
jgi:hypothetical protein